MVEVKALGDGLKAILKHADVAVEWDSCNFYDQLCAGIWLNNRTKKYWLDENTNGNGYILYARALSITWSEDPRYWKWIIVKESCNTSIEAAGLLRVTWLDIRWKVQASMLRPRVLYQAGIVVMIKKEAYGWEVAVNFELKQLDGTIDAGKENILKWPQGEWVEIPIGHFGVSDSDICGCGEIEFSLYEHGSHWKRGLVVKCAVIRPIIL